MNAITARQSRPGYLRNLIDSTRTGAVDGFHDGFDGETQELYDRLKDDPRFQKDGHPVTIGEFTQIYPQYKRPALLLGVIGGCCGGTTGFALGLVGRHYLDGHGA